MTESHALPGVATILDAVRQFGPDVAAYRQLGAISARLHPNGELLIFNYTPQATYGGAWLPVERVSRGLIVHWPTTQVVALPFEKFFNLNEQPETRLENLPERPIEVTAKLDGSLGITYWDGTRYAMATRGSFTGPQAAWATARLQAHPAIVDLPRDLTLLVEVIYPENRVVLNYGNVEGLFLIGARRLDGYDYNYAELTELAERFGLPLVPSEAVSHLGDLLPLVESRTGIEGWVVRYPNGLRVKIKTLEYLRLHKLLTNLTPERVREALFGDAESLAAFIMELPDEFQQETRMLADIIRAEVAAREARLRDLFAGPLAAAAQESRKAYALAVTAQHKPDAKYLFALLDEKPIYHMLLRDLDLTTLDLPQGTGESVWARQQRVVFGG